MRLHHAVIPSIWALWGWALYEWSVWSFLIALVGFLTYFAATIWGH